MLKKNHFSCSLWEKRYMDCGEGRRAKDIAQIKIFLK